MRCSRTRSAATCSRSAATVRDQLALVSDRKPIPLSEVEPAEAIMRRFVGAAMSLGALSPEARLPRSLFDSVADNLIRNALAKRAAERGTRVRVSLACDGRVALRVRDSGSAVPPEMENTLLRAPVDSASGLGIGLYQAARQAESSGYQLALETNLDGDVCFALTGPAA